MFTVVFPLEILTPSRRYPAVGRCIYCRASNDILTEEHIIPLAIASDAAVLPEASCLRCAEITGKFEGYCMRGMLGNFRIAAGAPTRRPKARKSALNVKIGKLDHDARTVTRIQKITIDRADYPIMYPSFTFPRAGLLVGRDRHAEVEYQVNVHRVGDQMEEFTKKYGAWEMDSTMFPLEFVRLIAKVAHSFSVAVHGANGFRPFLTDLILGRFDHLSHGLHWVGSEELTPAPTPELFSIKSEKYELVTGERWIVVWLQLFPFFGAPVYHVVVGEWDDA
jgi:hypothetical protein